LPNLLVIRKKHNGSGGLIIIIRIQPETKLGLRFWAYRNKKGCVKTIVNVIPAHAGILNDFILNGFRNKSGMTIILLAQPLFY
jgi:hypothetical protein